MLGANALRLTAESDTGQASPDRHASLPATIDVAAGGTLFGLELSFASSSLDATRAMSHFAHNPRTSPFVTVYDDTAYIELSSDPAHDVRSTSAIVTVEITDGSIEAIVIPRRGHGYEISYPSGNR